MKDAGVKRNAISSFLTAHETHPSMEHNWDGRGLCLVGYRRKDESVYNVLHMVAYENGMIYDPDPTELSPIKYTKYLGVNTYRGKRIVMYKKRLR